MEALAGLGFFLVVGGVVQSDKALRVRKERSVALARIKELEDEIAARKWTRMMQEREKTGSQLTVFNCMYCLFHTREPKPSPSQAVKNE